MIRRCVPAFALGLVLALGLTGCPDNPYKASTWIKKLNDRDSERAVTELENLGDPSAIEPLGQLWEDQSKPPRLLQVIISLARPLTPDEAKAKFATDYETTGRPASWDKALPYLQKALSEVDESNPRSVDSAGKAADAIGEGKISEGLDALIEIATKPVTKKMISAQVAAIRAMGKFDSDKSKAGAALTKIIDRDAPPNPRTGKKDQQRALEEKYGLYLGITGAAVNSLGDLRVPTAADTLVKSLYRTPELFTQVRRALVACGPTAEAALRKVLAGTNADITALFKDKKLDKYCGDKNDAAGDQCQSVSAEDFYAAVVLGDFYDPASVPDLLTALKRPPLAVYYQDDQPSPNTQYNAIFDALRKIGSPDAATAVHAIWADPKAEIPIRTLAIGAYPFLSREGQGTDELAKIAADNKADDGLRQEASTAFARLSSDPKDIDVLNTLAQKYFDAAAKKRLEADGKPLADSTAAQAVYDAQKKVDEAAEQNLLRMTNDKSKGADDIKAATATKKAADEVFKAQKKVYRDAQAPFKAADGAAKAYRGYGRMFQTHIARIVIAIQCKDDIACYAKTLSKKPADAAKDVVGYIKDINDKDPTDPKKDAWSKDEKLGLLEAEIERAMMELGKRGVKAAGQADLLLDNAKSDDRLIRQSILLALPKVAKKPCANCVTKLEAAIKAGEGKTTLGDLNLETTMLRNYYEDGKSAAAAEAPAPAPAAPAEAPADK